ncbi:beta-glucanase/beta-glucan synthetase [Paenibacillus rhizoplanae]|uniref:Beta-glucanase/beta-glucan synthetase n=2 Tax=Paenibacillus rhizoplanae TaxID=1917181 RepID=A0ABW5FB79_9BACL
MKKIWRYIYITSIFGMLLLATACSSDKPDPIHINPSDIVVSNSGDNLPQNPFEMDEKNVVLGSINHYAVNLQADEAGRVLPIQYNGGELKIDYSVNASGKARNVGFLLFIDGLPQPYKLDSSGTAYEYMHIFELEENKATPFTFTFTPITGKKGELLPIKFVSVYNPSFIPDMKVTASYGGYQTILEAGGEVFFNKDTEQWAVPLSSKQAGLLNVRQSTERVTQELLVSHGRSEKIAIETLDSKVFSELYVDGLIRHDNLKVENSGLLQITFKLFGHPGVSYRNTIYLNHKPLESQDGVSFPMALTKGNLEVLSAEINLDQLGDFSTFYVVSVPLNAEDFYDDVIILEKTPSLLLYKGAGI